ncbi:hypothetical protein [Neisseria sp. HMSC31F04]|nr:hypothetical protein [Neisseria sp. HMSC31F04]
MYSYLSGHDGMGAWFEAAVDSCIASPEKAACRMRYFSDGLLAV